MYSHETDQQFEVIRLLLDAGADPNSRCKYGSPLCDAVLRNNLDLVTMLLEAGASVNLAPWGIPQPVTPLEKAIRGGYSGSLQLMVQFVEKKGLVVLMGKHERAGAHSPLMVLPDDLVELIVDELINSQFPAS